MTAPESTVWGDIVTSSEKDTRQGRLGIYFEPTRRSTEVSIRVQVWFWSRTSIDDVNNQFNFEATGFSPESTKAVSVKHTSNTSWSTSNQTLCLDKTYPYDRSSTNTTATFTAKLSGIDILGKTMTVSRSYTIPALELYLILFWKNDGSGKAHGGLTKTYGQTIRLMSAPSRTGYTFDHWNTKADGTGMKYNAGDDYSRNVNAELYAIWIPKTYTVTYNSNGGSTVAAQTKTHDKPLTLTGTPTRDGYIFQGWSTSSSAIAATLHPGDTYTQEGDITLYAVWLLGYKPPRMYNVSVKRCTENGEVDDAGSFANVSFDWDSDKTVRSIEVFWAKTGTNAWSEPLSIAASGTSGVGASIQFGDDDELSADYLDPEVTYDIRIVVTDEKGSNDVIRSLFSQKFTIDFIYEKVLDQNGEVQSESTGVAFGKTAEMTDTVEFAFDAKFNKPVYGKVLGMDRLPAIPENSDINDYIEPGCYAVQMNTIAETCTNIPTDRAGRLEVWSATGEGIRTEEWSYIRQRYVPYRSANAVWERDITRNSDNAWDYGEWWRTSLTPAASTRVYDEPIVLFSGSSSDTISLSQPATDFAYLEIFFTDNNGEKGGYTKLHSPYNAVIDLWIIEAGGSNNTYIRRTYYTLSGTVLAPDSATAGYVEINSSVSHTIGTNYIKITKVLGRNS